MSAGYFELLRIPLLQRRTFQAADADRDVIVVNETMGMAGVFAYVVQQRTHEIGVHMALGARVSHIVGVVMRSSLLAIAGGAVAGLVGAFLASGLLRGYLFGLSATDPLAHLGVLVVLAVAGAAATLVPARNAARIEPVNALRHE